MTVNLISNRIRGRKQAAVIIVLGVLSFIPLIMASKHRMVPVYGGDDEGTERATGVCGTYGDDGGEREQHWWTVVMVMVDVTVVV